jgi:hypothetical protein
MLTIWNVSVELHVVSGLLKTLNEHYSNYSPNWIAAIIMPISTKFCRTIRPSKTLFSNQYTINKSVNYSRSKPASSASSDATATATPQTKTSSHPFLPKTSSSIPAQEEDDRHILSPRSTEYSKSGTDDAVAEQEHASFKESSCVDPVAQMERAGQGTEINPLEVSPANQEVSYTIEEKIVEDGKVKKRSVKGGATKGRIASTEVVSSGRLIGR